jgi:hypothetical protein
MIKPGEIQRKAREAGVRDQQIEKDYMLRMQARDFYDIWYLLEQHGMEADFYLDEFSRKCASKGLNPAGFQKKLAVDCLPIKVDGKAP